MKLPTKAALIEQSNIAISNMYDTVSSLPTLELSSLDPSKTALIVIDMVNGFVKFGALSSERVKNLEENIVNLTDKCSKAGFKLLALCDCHTDISPELSSFPPHCMENTAEAELIESLKAYNFEIINKNSAGALSLPEFEKWLSDNTHIENYIIAGDCTDICIYQNAVGLKARNNSCNKPCRVILPIDMIDTYDAPGHDADFLNITHICSMIVSGVEAVASVK